MTDKDMFKKNWIFILGIGFLFFAFLYAIKIGFDEGLIPEEGKIGLGIFICLTSVMSAYLLYKRKKDIIAQSLAGFGISILYATCAYASFVSQIQWSPNTLFISILAISGIVAFFGYKFEMRILVTMCMIGGLITPIVIKASSEQITLLFIYVLILNLVSLYLSISKKWHELRFISFLVTIGIYFAYYFYFVPENWPKPFFYIASIFLVYMVGLIFASYSERDNFEGINLYLGLINALNFTIWAMFIFKSFSLAYSIPLIFVGIVFIGVAIIIYKLTKENLFAPLIYLIAGILLLAFSVNGLSTLFSTKGMNFVINTFSWFSLVSILYFLGVIGKEPKLMLTGIGTFLLLLIYWFSVAWQVEWIENWLGFKYIPFLNPGAIVWMTMAIFSFYIALTSSQKLKDNDGKVLGNSQNTWELFFSIVGHLVIGGLLTIQIMNTWNAYDFKLVEVDIMLSVSWTIYSLLLFLWGAYTNGNVFRSFGSIVLILTSIKVLLYDLSGKSNGYKAIFFLILGVLIMSIALVNNSWRKQDDTKI
ncbi:DUF2339 domain-containing protein [Leptospira alstonii]|uniref:DUF2339 domain-containing protein n=1 Tax=Leptospira alstonii TaxID=28452 RepID=UPI0007742DE9|nr:DUF2339 domain-containing protein [Leptospira alstonii]